MPEDKLKELTVAEGDDDIIDRLERKYCYKTMAITLSEEEWFILNEVSTMTGLNKTMLFRMAINQLMREILTKRQLDKKVGQKKFLSKAAPEKDKIGDKRGKVRNCSAGIPEKIIDAIASYAKMNRLRSYEVYSKIIDEFLQEVQDAPTRPTYQQCPKDALRRSISMFEHTLQGLKALKKRDRISAYQVIHNAIIRFVEKNQLLSA